MSDNGRFRTGFRKPEEGREGPGEAAEGEALFVEERFNANEFPHEWRLYNGAHTEEYWRAHVEEYIEWYAVQWRW